MPRSVLDQRPIPLSPSSLHQPQLSNPAATAFRTNSIFHGKPLTLDLCTTPSAFPPLVDTTEAPFLHRTRPMTTHSSQVKYGQITPPEDNWKLDYEQPPMPFADPLAIEASSTVPDTTPIQPEPLGRDRRSSSSGGSSLGPTTSDAKVDKKDKYREKNRVAAAKCRAKKKNHVDGLEENHRTQSMLNSLLKQTEQNLRDELSFWRTQALQHAFCDCHAVQDYNLKKAKALAADKEFGGLDAIRHDPSCSGASPPGDSKSAMGSLYPSPVDFDMQQPL